MLKLFTITGNLLAETTAVYEFPRQGSTVRAIGESKFQVGGKGVNVARAATALGLPAFAAVFPAGFNGAKCVQMLKRDGVAAIVSEIPGETRCGLVCSDMRTGVQTTFLGTDLPVSAEAFKNAVGKIGKSSEEGDIIALCGSFPGWSGNFAGMFFNLCAKNRLNICADTYGPPLDSFAGKKCGIVKINRRELFEFLKMRDGGSERDFCRAFENARRTAFANAGIFAVTDGPSPILADVGCGTEKISPPKISHGTCTTGCGDAMLARLISEIFVRKTALLEALKLAAAYASALAGAGCATDPRQFKFK